MSQGTISDVASFPEDSGRVMHLVSQMTQGDVAGVTGRCRRCPKGLKGNAEYVEGVQGDYK